MKVIHPLFNLFYPKSCVCCSTPLLDQERLICLNCRFDLPFVDNGNYIDNPTTRIFQGRIPIVLGASFLYYHEIGKTKSLIHQLKYRGNQFVGIFLADGLGRSLIQSEMFKDIDMIIPVPLHQKKLKQRGYNQLTTFGEQLEKLLAIEYRPDILKRVSFTQTQTRKKRIDRFQNTLSKFYIQQPEVLKNKQVLLIDDVITTGATLEACCKEIQKADGVKISIITMAITE